MCWAQWEFEPGTVEWWAQMDPLDYDGPNCFVNLLASTMAQLV